MITRSDTVSPSIENIYGSEKRLNWVISHLQRSDRIIELGCGTGYMLTMPLISHGYNIVGIDRDEKSISYGHRVAAESGLDGSRIKCVDLSDLHGPFDVVIVSEVLEHLDDANFHSILISIHHSLREGGLLLVTVPNGYGWFELESFVWNKLRLGAFLSLIRMDRALLLLKIKLSGKSKNELIEHHPSSLDTSPHVQRFTYASLQRRLTSANFRVVEITGSTLLAGPLSNLLFTGYNSLTKLNGSLAGRLPFISSGFYAACVKTSAEKSSVN